jgi:hypothetical protein
MSAFGTYTRDELRQAYAEAWRKQRAGAPLTPLEAMIADVIELHTEYQPIVEDPVRTLSFEPDASSAENPFLHMGLHMAIREQMSIDRPPGIRDLQGRLVARFGDLHQAEHILMESLAETLWEAQRAGRPPDEARYLDLVRRRLSRG